MSKKSKKKTQSVTLDLQWGTDAPSLPTAAAPIPERRERRGYGGGGFGGGGGGGYGNRSNFESDSDRGPWRRGPSSSASSGNQGGSSFGSSSFGNRGPQRTSSYNFRNNNNGNMNNNNNNGNDENFNPSENDTNWRGGQKKEAPKISLNSRANATNSNPWRKDANSANSDLGRSAFGSKQATSPSSFGGGSKFGNNSGRSSFGGGSRGFGADSGGSSFGGGGRGFGGGRRFGSDSKFSGGSGASSSKFSTGGGFGGSILSKIDNGGPRLSYGGNKRFGGLLNDGDGGNKRREIIPPQAPEKVASSRFGGLNQASSGPTEQTAYPSLAKNVTAPKQRSSKTVEQLKKELFIPKQEKSTKDNKPNKSNKKQQQKGGKMKESKNNKSAMNGNGSVKDKKQQKQQSEQKRIQQQEQQRKQREAQQAKANKKLISKFNKECLGKNKPIDINNETLKLIEVVLSQKENILLRDEENYEKIARLLANVIVNDKNMKNKNGITLDKVYDVIYNKTRLQDEDNESFLALVLEILSQIETNQSCLLLVHMLSTQDILNKYLSQTQGIKHKSTMTEFIEYGLQYAYPLNVDDVSNKGSLEDILGNLKQMKSKNMIYSNYQCMYNILEYVLKNFYFNKCVDDDEKNEDLAKELIVSNKITEKTTLAQIIKLLHCKNDDDEDKEDEEEYDEDEEEEVDNHSLLILSSIISISSSLNNNNNGLLSLLKCIEAGNLMKFNVIKKFWLDMNDKYTQKRSSAMRKLGDWYVELDARSARMAMERQENEEYDDGDYNDEYAGNLLEKPKHKTAADYQAFSLYTE